MVEPGVVGNSRLHTPISPSDWVSDTTGISFAEIVLDSISVYPIPFLLPGQLNRFANGIV
jgi:hypothetical protein